MLDLGFTENENWRPFRIPLLVWAIFGIVILSAVVFVFAFRPRGGILMRNVTFLRGKGFLTIIVLIFAVGAASIFLEGSMESFSGGSRESTGKTAVLRATQGYRIPDLKGAVSDEFDEGQPVFVGDYRGDWCFAETPDGRSGWVPSWSVVPY